MKPSLPHFKQFLTANGVSVKDIRYLGPGRRLVAIGFDAWSEAGTIEVEPQYPRGYFISFDSSTPHWDIFRQHWSQHYSPRKYGFQPCLTKPLKTLKPNICEFFKIKSK